jgi:hypothetical protein
MSENRVLRRLFGPKREEVVGGWRRHHDEEPYNFYALPGIIRVIKSMRMRGVGHVARTEGMEKCIKVLIGKAERK